MRAALFLLVLLVGACDRTQTPPPEITVSPNASVAASSAPSVPSTLPPAVASSTPDASSKVDPEPEPFGAQWLSCRKDDDCTYVSLGCCHGRAINKKYQAEGQKVLDDSKLERCPVKAACAATPVVCSHAICKFKP